MQKKSLLIFFFMFLFILPAQLISKKSKIDIAIENFLDRAYADRNYPERSTKSWKDLAFYKLNTNFKPLAKKIISGALDHQYFERLFLEDNKASFCCSSIPEYDPIITRLKIEYDSFNKGVKQKDNIFEDLGGIIQDIKEKDEYKNLRKCELRELQRGYPPDIEKLQGVCAQKHIQYYYHISDELLDIATSNTNYKPSKLAIHPSQFEYSSVSHDKELRKYESVSVLDDLLWHDPRGKGGDNVIEKGLIPLLEKTILNDEQFSPEKFISELKNLGFNDKDQRLLLQEYFNAVDVKNEAKESEVYHDRQAMYAQLKCVSPAWAGILKYYFKHKCK